MLLRLKVYFRKLTVNILQLKKLVNVQDKQKKIKDTALQVILDEDPCQTQKQLAYIFNVDQHMIFNC